MIDSTGFVRRVELVAVNQMTAAVEATFNIFDRVLKANKRSLLNLLGGRINRPTADLLPFGPPKLMLAGDLTLQSQEWGESSGAGSPGDRAGVHANRSGRQVGRDDHPKRDDQRFVRTGAARQGTGFGRSLPVATAQSPGCGLPMPKSAGGYGPKSAGGSRAEGAGTGPSRPVDMGRSRLEVMVPTT